MSRRREPGAHGPGNGNGPSDPRHPATQDPRLVNARGEKRPGIPGVLSPEEIVSILGKEFHFRASQSDRRDTWRLVSIDDGSRLAYFVDAADTRDDAQIMYDINNRRSYSSEHAASLIADSSTRIGFPVGYTVRVNDAISMLRSELPAEKARRLDEERAAREQAQQAGSYQGDVWSGRPGVPMGPGDAETGVFTPRDAQDRVSAPQRRWDDGGSSVGQPATGRQEPVVVARTPRRFLDETQGPQELTPPIGDPRIHAEVVAQTRGGGERPQTDDFVRREEPLRVYVDRPRPQPIELPPAPERGPIPAPPVFPQREPRPAQPQQQPIAEPPVIPPPRPRTGEDRPRFKMPELPPVPLRETEIPAPPVVPAVGERSLPVRPFSEAPTGPPTRTRESGVLQPVGGNERSIPDPSSSNPFTVETNGLNRPTDLMEFGNPWDAEAPTDPGMNRAATRERFPIVNRNEPGRPPTLFEAETVRLGQAPLPGEPGFGDAPTELLRERPAREFGAAPTGPVSEAEAAALRRIRERSARPVEQPSVPAQQEPVVQRTRFGKWLRGLIKGDE